MASGAANRRLEEHALLGSLTVLLRSVWGCNCVAGPLQWPLVVPIVLCGVWSPLAAMPETCGPAAVCGRRAWCQLCCVWRVEPSCCEEQRAHEAPRGAAARHRALGIAESMMASHVCSPQLMHPRAPTPAPHTPDASLMHLLHLRDPVLALSERPPRPSGLPPGGGSWGGGTGAGDGGGT